jgi:PAS domain S-box-containing protein
MQTHKQISDQKAMSILSIEINSTINSRINSMINAPHILATLLKNANYETTNFNNWAKDIFLHNKYLASVQFAKDGIVSHIYPLNEHKKALGHDLLKDKRRDDGAIKAIKAKGVVFVGPIKLIQNNKYAIIARLPIFYNSQFWGFSTSIAYVDKILKHIEKRVSSHGFYFSIEGSNPDQSHNTMLVDTIKSRDTTAQKFDISVPNGKWTLSLQPKESSSIKSIEIYTLFFIIWVVSTWLLYRYEYKIYNYIKEQENIHNKLDIQIEKTPLSVITISPDGKILRWNKASEDIFGYSSDEAIGKSIVDTIIPKHVIEQVKPILQKLKNGQMDIKGVFDNIDKDGNQLKIEWFNTPFFDEDGNIVEIMSIGNDITQKSINEEKLRVHQKELESIFESISDGIAITDLESNFLMCNDAFAKMVGYSKDEILKNNCLALSDPNDHDMIKSKLDTLLTFGSVEPFDKKCMTKYGEWIVTTVSLALLPDQKRLVVGYRDSTERVNYQNKLKNLNIELEKKVNEQIEDIRRQEQMLQHQSKLATMGEMIGAIAHQWRQPLNALSIRIQKLKYNLAKDEINEEFIKKFIAENKSTIDFMSKTIDNFRNFFRIDKQMMEFDLLETVEEVTSMLSAQLKNNEITLTVDGDSFAVDGYKTEFQQVVLNIIDNAKDNLIKKEIKEPKIDITLKDHTLIIADNGGGIDESIITRVFEPYFTTKAQGEGTGIGLYMAKTIIEKNMNGTIYAKNSKDGAMFIIEFRR